MDLATLFFHSPMHTRKEKRAIGRLREARTQSFFLGISVVDGPKILIILGPFFTNENSVSISASA